MVKYITRIYVLLNMLRFKIYGMYYGNRLRVHNWIYLTIKRDAKIVIGDNFRYTSGGGYNPICRNLKGYIRVDKGAVLTIGNNVGMSSTVLWVKESVSIGNNTIIGGDSVIIDTDCHNLAWKQRRDKDNDYASCNSKPIVIGEDVMIGARCIILKGVHIGDRSVIGAGSVVTKDVPADCLAAGNPCEVVKQLNYD